MEGVLRALEAGALYSKTFLEHILPELRSLIVRIVTEKNSMWKLDKLHIWLSNSENQSQDNRYTHRLLQENLDQRDDIFESLKNLVQLAHKDARRHFRGFTANTLDPDDFSSEYDHAQNYPQDLPLTTLKGYFGEILAGLVAENFSPFGLNDWKVPAFIFRSHDAAFNQLERVKQNNKPRKAIPGHLGDDCLAFEMSNYGYIKRSLVCESKCTSTHDTSLIASVHTQVSDLGILPVSLWKIVEILKDRAGDEQSTLS